MKESTEGSGDCFIVAARMVIDDPSLTLVHGIPLGTAGETEGRRYWHAWVEQVERLEHPGLAAPMVIERVIDQSNGGYVIMPVGAYYNIGRIEQTWRYTATEALALMDETGHYGPWVALEPAGDVSTNDGSTLLAHLADLGLSFPRRQD